jgi:alkylhydroperoxidase/carboxymuconolactone decarboxylase family protein YurZ
MQLSQINIFGGKMMNTLQQCADDILNSLNSTAGLNSDGYSAFLALKSSLNNKRLSPSVSKTLLGVAMGVAGSCEHCARRNARAAAHTGASEQEIMLALQRGILMSSGPATIVAAQALEDFREALASQRGKLSNPSIASKTHTTTSASLPPDNEKHLAAATLSTPIHEPTIHL